MGNASAPFRFSIGQEGKGYRTLPETSNDELEEEMERTGAWTNSPNTKGTTGRQTLRG